MKQQLLLKACASLQEPCCLMFASRDLHMSPGQLNIPKPDKMLSNGSGVSSGTGLPRCLNAIHPWTSSVAWPVGTCKSDHGQNASAGGSSFCLCHFLFIFYALPITKYF